MTTVIANGEPREFRRDDAAESWTTTSEPLSRFTELGTDSEVGRA
jgi:hypothetical protein